MFSVGRVVATSYGAFGQRRSVLCLTKSRREGRRTLKINDTVVGVVCLIMAEDFSDISDGEVVCATQLVEELNR